VIGIDMLEPMLERARRGAEGVVRNLGFDNLDFRQGYLEALPVEDGTVDLVISNCVLNLSPDKRRTYGEILRVLRPGGRMVVADVVCDEDPGPAIRNDATYRGQCVGGTLTQRDLVGILDESGFAAFRIVKRFPYRLIHGHPFFSMTFEARRPLPSPPVKVIYRGPAASLTAPGGSELFAGVTTELPEWEARMLGDQVLVLDEAGAVTNLDMGPTCSCRTESRSS
jgi:SAM-dependent methyltransferase